MLVVDVMWNKIAQQNPIYKNVLIQISGCSKLTLTKITNKKGLELLDMTFKKHMLENKVTDYFKDDMKYAFG